MQHRPTSARCLVAAGKRSRLRPPVTHEPKAPRRRRRRGPRLRIESANTERGSDVDITAEATMQNCPRLARASS